MTLLKKSVIVKASTLPDAGKGLFAKTDIAKGSLILEYIGKISTWKEVDNTDCSNVYIYYVTRNYVIDARRHRGSLARYVNDARGLSRIKGITNNAEYVEIKKRVFIKAKKDIKAGQEIFVQYGKEYWDAIRHNIKVDRISKK